jgi:hypothetical protein
LKSLENGIRGLVWVLPSFLMAAKLIHSGLIGNTNYLLKTVFLKLVEIFYGKCKKTY